MELLTIITPVFNGAKYIEETVSSVFNSIPESIKFEYLLNNFFHDFDFSVNFISIFISLITSGVKFNSLLFTNDLKEFIKYEISSLTDIIYKISESNQIIFDLQNTQLIEIILEYGRRQLIIKFIQILGRDFPTELQVCFITVRLVITLEL